MPKVVETEPDYDVAVAEVGAATRPIVKALVVYLGAKRNKSVPLKGRVFVERFGEGADAHETRTATGTGNTCYDFSTHGADGRPVPKDRFMAATHRDPDVRGKRFEVCEHPDHLWRFQTDPALYEAGQPVFKIKILAADQKLVIDEYFARKTRSQRRQRSDFAAVSARG